MPTPWCCEQSAERTSLTYIVTKEGGEAAFIKSPVTFLAEIHILNIEANAKHLDMGCDLRTFKCQDLFCNFKPATLHFLCKIFLA